MQPIREASASRISLFSDENEKARNSGLPVNKQDFPVLSREISLVGKF